MQAIQYLERMLIQAQQQVKNESESQEKAIDIDPKTYCKLGHFHLLLEDFTKGNYSLTWLYHVILTKILYFISFQLCLRIRNSGPSNQITGKTPIFCTAKA